MIRRYHSNRGDNLVSIPNNRIENFQREDQRAGLVSAMTSAYLQTPLYAARWNYTMRPSVWKSMAEGNRGVRWHGIQGFRGLMAGNVGIGYRGNERGELSALNPNRWIIEGAGYGLQHGGRAISRGVHSSLMRNAIPGMGATINTPSSRLYRFGLGMERFGTGMRTGGIGGGIAGIGGTRATATGNWIQKFAGGGYYSQIGGYGAMRFNYDYETLSNIYSRLATPSHIYDAAGAMTLGPKPVFADLLSPNKSQFVENLGATEVLARRIPETARIRDIFMGKRGFARKVATMRSAGTITTDQARVMMATEATTGAIGRSIRFTAGARLMSVAVVGMNVALIGGIVGAGLFRGATSATDAMLRWTRSNSIRQLEFGSGVQPFMYGATERSKALQAISNSRLNYRSAIGNEAALAAEYS
jgi:hypothetical protein